MTAVALADTVGLCNADVYPLGPVHEYVVIPTGPPVRLNVVPIQTGPLLLAVATGTVYTVTVAVCKQPVAKVYDMMDVPAETPETTPRALIVATKGDALLQVPPAVASARVVVKPAHTVNVPVIAAGNGFTVTITL